MSEAEYHPYRPAEPAQPAQPTAPDGMKRCPKCGETKPVESFGIDRNRADGLCFWCRDCANAAKRLRRASTPEDPDVAHDRHLRRTYGITLAQYNWMLEVQGGVCAICGQPERNRNGINGSEAIRRLVVDHDHETSQIRALLCSACNTGIGNFAHDIDRMKAAIRYLEKTIPKRRKP